MRLRSGVRKHYHARNILNSTTCFVYERGRPKYHNIIYIHNSRTRLSCMLGSLRLAPIRDQLSINSIYPLAIYLGHSVESFIKLMLQHPGQLLLLLAHFAPPDDRLSSEGVRSLHVMCMLTN